MSLKDTLQNGVKKAIVIGVATLASLGAKAQAQQETPLQDSAPEITQSVSASKKQANQNSAEVEVEATKLLDTLKKSSEQMKKANDLLDKANGNGKKKGKKRLNLERLRAKRAQSQGK